MLCTGLVVAAAPSPATGPFTNLPPHPRLLFGKTDLSVIRERIRTEDWAKERFEGLKSQADQSLAKPVKLPARGGQWYHYYACPAHGARLRTESPTRHVCPVDGQVLTGQPYDDVVLMGDHTRWATAVRELGMVYQFTGDGRYAEKGREILLEYAKVYGSYPLHNIRGEPKVGGGKVGPQTLDEAVWLITMVEGADLLWDTLAPGEQTEIARGLIRPAVQVIREHRMGIHNIQCWKNSAVGLAGLLLGDHELVNEALNSPSGYWQQLAKGVSRDGVWFEGAWGYHFYTLHALVRLTEGALHSGINLYGPELKSMFDGPLDLAMPDLQLPAFNDSHAVSLPSQARLYELALARYGDKRYRHVLGRGNRASDISLLCGLPQLPGTAEEFQPVSRNFPNSGYAVLAEGTGPCTGWLALKYGPHGGGHGHPDKLNFVLYGAGDVIAPDPGTASYGVPIQAGWYRTTLAHNTLTIDEQSQAAAEGKCEAFVSTNGFAAVMALAGPIARGVQFRRTAALLEGSLLVVVDQVKCDKARQLDLAYHNLGSIKSQPKGEPWRVPEAKGYSYIRGARSVKSSDGLSLEFDSGRGRGVGWTMAAGEETTFILGTGVGAHTEDRVPMVIARRHSAGTAFAWCVQWGRETGSPRIRAERVEGFGGTALEGTEALALVVGSGPTTRWLLVNPAGAKVRYGGREYSGRLVALKPGTGQGMEVQAIAP